MSPNITLGSLVAQMVKNLPAMRKAWVQSLEQEDTLEKGMATHSSTLAWRSPWTEEPGGLQSMGSQRVQCNWVTNTFTSLSDIASGFPSGSVVKNPPAVQETQVWSLGQGDPLEEEMATHSSILACKNPIQASVPGVSKNHTWLNHAVTQTEHQNIESKNVRQPKND